MYKGSCHCQKVSWEYLQPISKITACNCTLCVRYGTLWAYGHKDKSVKLEGETKFYSRENGELEFHFCENCGCVVYWLAKQPNEQGEITVAVNARLVLDPQLIQDIPIRHFDGLHSFQGLDGPESVVKDLWF